MQLQLGPCILLGRKYMAKQPYAWKDTWSPLQASFETASLNRLAFRALPTPKFVACPPQLRKVGLGKN
jgi:hypothetical protein